MNETRARPSVRDEARAAAFADLIGARLDSSYRLACAILGDRLEAEEACQEAALRAWRGWSSLKDPSRVDAWFGRIMVNVCRDRIRKRRSALSLSAAEGSTSDPVRHVVELHTLREAIAELSSDHRIVIVLRYVADLSLEEIADRVGIPVGTVKSRLHHALKLLRASYAAVGRAEDRGS